MCVPHLHTSPWPLCVFINGGVEVCGRRGGEGGREEGGREEGGRREGGTDDGHKYLAIKLGAYLSPFYSLR